MREINVRNSLLIIKELLSEDIQKMMLLFWMKVFQDTMQKYYLILKREVFLSKI